MGYELWDRFTGNLIGDFDTQVEALEVVRAQLEADGPKGLDRIALTRVADQGRTTTVIAEGAELLLLIQAAAG